MELDKNNDPGKSAPPSRNGPRSGAKYFLNVLIVVLLVVVGYFSYAFLSHGAPTQQTASEKGGSKPEKIIQLDVLNGCGARGVAAKFTNYLRAGGFDVVEMKNYKTNHIPHTMVVDRVGNLEAARRVAASLGVSDRNVIQQINPDYFVDVSVIVGDDYSNLRPSK